jgi:hypothetical protein
MTRSEKALAYMDEYVDEFLRLEPREDYDPCILGVGRRFNDTVLIYSIKAIIDMHMRHGMTYEEADEYFEYNTIGGWYGEQTPMFLNDLIDLDGTLVEEEISTEMT